MHALLCPGAQDFNILITVILYVCFKFFCYLSFHHCDKIPDVNNLKVGKVYSGSRFQEFQSSDLLFLGLSEAECHGGEHVVEQRERKSWGQVVPFKDTPS